MSSNEHFCGPLAPSSGLIEEEHVCATVEEEGQDKFCFFFSNSGFPLSVTFILSDFKSGEILYAFECVKKVRLYPTWTEIDHRLLCMHARYSNTRQHTGLFSDLDVKQ